LGSGNNHKDQNLILRGTDLLINWSRKYSLWPMFFGLSCCFIEESVAFTSRYDISRFGAEVLRGTPRQADLLIISGTVFKKIAPVVLRLFEQMTEPKWVISMGSCANCGGMYDVYSVVQGVDQILPVDVYIPGCPPRPEAVLHGLIKLQEKIMTEQPTRSVFHLEGGSQGTEKTLLVDGVTKQRDPRGPGYNGTRIRGTSVTPPFFPESRSHLMWTPPPARPSLERRESGLAQELLDRFPTSVRQSDEASDMLTFRVEERDIKDALRFLKTGASIRFRRLDDLTAIDESARSNREEYPDYTLVYQLLSYESASRLRLKVPLKDSEPVTESITDIWPAADWYEREVFDLFGIRFKGHPNLRRLIMPPDWEGHPLRKDYPGRATGMAPYTLSDARHHQPLSTGLYRRDEDGEEQLLLNLGPHHPSTHGLIRFIVSLKGEVITALDMDIGYHHRGVEKIGERQSWHQFIPYTDRVDYLSGVANNLSYLTAVEILAGIRVPDRAQFVRVMLSELFRLSSHLMFFGTMTMDVGAMTPPFYSISDREMIMDLIELITGARLHPAWFRLGGVAADLPEGWKQAVDSLVKHLRKRIPEYEALITKNPIFEARTRGVGHLSLEDALDWGVTGPNLRACGLAWDLRKDMPYSAYHAFTFDIPTQTAGDSYARYLVRVEEMLQSLRIIEQAADNMPPGRFVCDDYRYAIPEKGDTLTDIESLIHHFINVSRGPKLPKGEAYAATEMSRGEQGYYVVSDGLNMAYRMRIRTPDFANVQAIPLMAVGGSLSDLIAIIGSVDYILPDLDR
jgi:NADH dehydrogenase I D subunit